jgi:hypothetical protein
MSGCLV